MVNRSRDYTWFGIIADVRRRGYIFDFEPSTRPIPSDACHLWQKFVNDYGELIHDKCWFRPAEIIKANQVYNDLYQEQYGFSLMPRIDHERVPNPEDEMSEVIIDFGYPEPKTIVWAGTIRDFIGQSAAFEECVRLVVGFDS